MNNLLKTHIIPEDVINIRLDRYAYKIFDIFPSNKSAYKAVKKGEILVNGEFSRPDYRIKPGQKIQLLKNIRKKPKPFQLPLKIIFEDEYLAVIEKPPGFVVNGNQYRTIENALLFNSTGTFFTYHL